MSIIFFLIRSCGKVEHLGHHEMQRFEEENKNEATALKDSVCGMEVKEKAASLTSEHLGRTFHFCSEQCKKLFDLHPNKYIISTN